MAKKRAVVVGGGLAGLTAAVELVQKKDFQVTVLEKQRRCGGKLASWPHPATGDFVEHGMHGWWRNYTNFFALMKRVGISCDVRLDRRRVVRSYGPTVTSRRLDRYVGRHRCSFWGIS